MYVGIGKCYNNRCFFGFDGSCIVKTTVTSFLVIEVMLDVFLWDLRLIMVKVLILYHINFLYCFVNKSSCWFSCFGFWFWYAWAVFGCCLLYWLLLIIEGHAVTLSCIQDSCLISNHTTSADWDLLLSFWWSVFVIHEL